MPKKVALCIMRFLIFLFSLLLFGNSTFAQAPPQEAKVMRDIKAKLYTDPNLRHSFHGWAMYDLDSGRYLLEHEADRYFTPASNVKLATYYAAQRILEDTLAAFRYMTFGEDSLVIWGTGSPALLHPYFSDTAAFNFLKNSQRKIYFAPNNFKTSALGTGWAWEDYDSRYAPERSSLPLYGNLVRFEAEEACTFMANPVFFENFSSESEYLSANRGFRVARSIEDNAFAFHIGELERSRSHRLPFRTDPAFMARLLADTLEALVLTTDYPLPANVRHLRTQALAPIYAEMMKESDNFLAEQFLLMCSDKIHEKLDTDAAIQYVQRKYFNDLSDAPRWVDGLGMSRYNLFTPRSFVEILQKIWRDVPRERIYAQFACGGRSGTLKRRYRSAPAFLYAKTGTLSNNHCLSGFLITRSGRRLAFSFLNNHHRVSSSKIASIMEDVLLEVYRKL